MICVDKCSKRDNSNITIENEEVETFNMHTPKIIKKINKRGLRLWCLTPLSTIFQLYCHSQFYCWRKPEYLEKTTNLSQVTDKLLSHVLSSTPRMSRIRTYVSGDNYWSHIKDMNMFHQICCDHMQHLQWIKHVQQISFIHYP